LKTRIITGVVLVAVLIAMLFLSSTVVFPIMISLISMIGVTELLRANRIINYRPFFVISLIFAAIAPFMVRGYIPFSFSNLCIVFALAFVCCLIHKHGRINPERLGFSFAMSMFISYGLCSMMILVDKTYGIFYFAVAMICAWVTDAGAYFVGSFFGKHKLAPNLSPNKTVEGAIGGVAVNVIISVIFGIIYTAWINKDATLLFVPLLLSVAAGSVLGMLGDLFESAVKRYYKIKDFGSLMPGHGGVLDRFDSVLIVAPFFVMLTQYVDLIR
jgi:phosphatidate cytidylyltransferase